MRVNNEMKQYFMNNPFWVDSDNFGQLLNVCREELRKERGDLEERMRDMINNNEQAWQEICDLSIVVDKYKDESMRRQDKVEFGVEATVSEKDLTEISLNSSSFEFDAAQSYDYESYLVC